MEQKSLTKKEAETLEAIKTLLKKGYPPTIREIAAHRGVVSVNTIKKPMNKLREKGYIDWMDGSARTLRVL